MWSKVDDKLHGNSKSRRAGDAMALWVMALSFAGDQLTDGWVPPWFVMSIENGPKHAARLVEVGLWEAATRDGEDGWEFHDYLDFQMSREQVLDDRAKAAERKRRSREKWSRERDEQGQS